MGRTDTHAITVNLPVAVTFLYDQNGNLRTNGSVVMAYDDENQLIAMTNAGAWASTFTYDGRMRMRVSKDFAWVAGAWVQTNEVRRVYDGMLVLQERNNLGVPTVTLTRGLDLSGSLQGAGGIGGLLALSDHSTLNSSNSQPASYYYHSDGNGNVTCLADLNQNVVARYLCDPFGNALSATGPKAGMNRHRFSSKEWHAPSGLVYYGYRWYVPELQRWVNRDPIQERGSLNLYDPFGNSPINNLDPDGRLGLLGVLAAVGIVAVLAQIVVQTFHPQQLEPFPLPGPKEPPSFARHPDDRQQNAQNPDGHHHQPHPPEEFPVPIFLPNSNPQFCPHWLQPTRAPRNLLPRYNIPNPPQRLNPATRPGPARVVRQRRFLGAGFRKLRVNGRGVGSVDRDGVHPLDTKRGARSRISIILALPVNQHRGSPYRAAA